MFRCKCWRRNPINEILLLDTCSNYFIFLSTMTSTNPTNLTAPPQNEPTRSADVHETTQEVAPTEPKHAADDYTSNSQAAASTSSPPLSNTNMTITQDTDAPSLPDRPSTQERVAATDVNQPTLDPQVASLQSIFPDFDAAVLYVLSRVWH
jgi:hypothetical protein